MISLTKWGISAVVISIALIVALTQTNSPTFVEVDIAQASELTGGSPCSTWFHQACDDGVNCPTAGCFVDYGIGLALWARPTDQFYCNGTNNSCGLRYSITGCLSASDGK